MEVRCEPGGSDDATRCGFRKASGRRVWETTMRRYVVKAGSTVAPARAVTQSACCLPLVNKHGSAWAQTWKETGIALMDFYQHDILPPQPTDSSVTRGHRSH